MVVIEASYKKKKKMETSVQYLILCQVVQSFAVAIGCGYKACLDLRVKEVYVCNYANG